MPQIAILSASDKGELDRALKKQKKKAQIRARKKKLKKRDNLLQSIFSLSEYQLIIINYRVAINYLSYNLFITLSTIFDFI